MSVKISVYKKVSVECPEKVYERVLEKKIQTGKF